MSCIKPRTFSKTLPPKNIRHKDLQNANALGLTGYCRGGGMSVLMRGNRSTTTDLGTQHPRKPSTPANRSKPDSLTPPNGSDWAMYVEQKSLIEVMPASNCCPSCSARFLLPAKTFEPKPKSQSFANRTASSSDLTLQIDNTGPKTSSFMIFMSCVTFKRTVGG